MARAWATAAARSPRMISAHRDVDAALMRCQLVADPSREVASFVRADRAPCRSPVDKQRPVRLPLEYLAQPPANLPGHAQAAPPRRNMVRPNRLRRERRSRAPPARESTARGLRFRGRSPRPLRLLLTSGGSNEPYQESSSALSASALHARRRRRSGSRRIVGKRGVEPRQPFANAALHKPHRLQEGRAPKPL